MMQQTYSDNNKRDPKETNISNLHFTVSKKVDQCQNQKP